MIYIYRVFAFIAVFALLDAISRDLAVTVLIFVFLVWLYRRAVRPVTYPGHTRQVRRTLEPGTIRPSRLRGY